MGERGFTLVELLVAMFVLLVGMAASIALLDGANASTSRTKAREQGVALQRELVEAARSVSYESLVPGGVNQAAPVSAAGRAHAVVGGDTSGPWTIQRRDVTYTVSLGVCSVDDAKDGTGVQDVASFCATGAGDQNAATQCGALIRGGSGGGALAGDCGIDADGDGAPEGLHGATSTICGTPCDRNPDDYKRIVTLVTWRSDGTLSYARQTSTVVNPGLSAGPAVTDFTMTAPELSKEPAPITDPNQGSLSFQALTGTRRVASLAWSVDGTPTGTATGDAAGTTWAFDWTIGTTQETVDGVYVVGARAFDSYGVFGASKAVTVELNRAAPFAPVAFVAGRNRTHASPQEDLVEFEWAPNKERDVIGYRVYRTDTGAKVCDELARATACRDTGAFPADLRTYRIVAVDRAPDGSDREGAGTTDVEAAYAPPQPPGSADVATSTDGEVIRWQLSPSPEVTGYRIYRNGVLYKDRIDRLAGDQITYTDLSPPAGTPTYYVTAVTADLAESTPVQASRISG